MNMTFVRDISSAKDVRAISLASCFSLVSMCYKEIPGAGMVFLRIGVDKFNPVPSASFSSKMKLRRS